MLPISVRWPWLLIAVLVLGGLAPPSAAQGPLRRLLFGPPRPSCVPVPPVCVEMMPAPLPKEPIAQEKEPWGTLQGRVVWKGDLPRIQNWVERFRSHPNAATILKAPKEDLVDPSWRIDPKTKGIANVCVYLKRPKDGMMPIHPADKVRKEPVVMDAPYTFFTPHMVAVYPEWFDGKDRGETGQKFMLKLTSEIAISARFVGDPRFNPGYNLAFLGRTQREVALKPQKLPVIIQSDFHPWANARVWVLDHPYFAITKADGTYTIPRVPADMEVQVMAWHEAQGWLLTKDGQTMKLTRGKNTLDIEMSAK